MNIQKQCIWLALLVLALAGCSALDSIGPTAEPTRAFSGPTREFAPTIVFLPPTRSPLEEIEADGPGHNNLTAAAVAAQSVLPPLVVTDPAGLSGMGLRVQLAAPDGTPLLGNLLEYRPSIDQALQARVPGILLLGGAVQTWGDFPLRLRDQGYTVLVMELPQAGASADDFAVMLSSLTGVGTVNPGLIGVIGAGLGADVALNGCALDLLCDTLALLSPIGQNAVTRMMAGYNPRPLLLAASREDTIAFDTAQTARLAATGAATFLEFDNAGRGVDLLVNQPQLAETIFQWLARTLVE